MPKNAALMPQVRTASAAAANISDGYIHSVYGDGFPVKKKKIPVSYKSIIEHRKKKTACEKVNIRKCVFVHEVWRE